MDLVMPKKFSGQDRKFDRIASPRMGSRGSPGMGSRQSPIESEQGPDAKRQLHEAQATWVEERKLLVDLLEKNQKLTASTQAALMNEKQEIEEHHRKLEESMRNRIEHLKSENTLLREKGGARKMTSPNSTLSKRQPAQNKNQLFKEIERVELMFENKESEYISEINRLTNELKIADDKNKAKSHQLRKDKNALEAELKTAKQKEGVVENHMNKEVEYLKTKLEQQTKLLRKKDADLDDLRTDYEERTRALLHQKNEGEDIWTYERQRLVQDKNLINEILEVKERNIEGQISVKQEQAEQSVKQLKEQMKILRTENQGLKTKMEKLEASKKTREDNLADQIEQHKGTAKSLNEICEERDAAFAAQLESLMKQIKNLQNSYNEREGSYTDEVKHLSEDLNKYHQLMEEAQQKMQGGKRTSVNFHLQKEIEALNEAAAIKSEELSKLRNLYINEKHSERQSVTKCVTACYNWLDTIRREHGEQVSEKEKLRVDIINANDAHTSQELTQATELKNMTTEMSELNVRLAKYADNTFERENNDLKHRVEQQAGEIKKLQHSNGIYIKSIKDLEQIIQQKQKPDEEMSFEYAEQFKARTVEITRLTEENQGHIETNKKLEERYQGELHDVYGRLEIANREVKKLQDLRDKARAAKAKKNFEDLSAWSIRQQAMKRTITRLEEQLKKGSETKATYTKLSRKISELEVDELRMLRIECQTKETWATNFSEMMEREKAEMQEELDRLREMNKNTIQKQEELSKLMQQEYELLVMQRQSYEQREAARLDQINEEQETIDGIIKNMKNEEHRILSSSRALLNNARESSKALELNLLSEKDLHATEMQSHREISENDTLILQEKVKVLEKLITGQKKQISELNKALDTERSTNTEEAKALRNQMGSMRKQVEDKSVIVVREREKINEELERLSKIINLRESGLNKSFTKKIIEMRKMMTSVRMTSNTGSVNESRSKRPQSQRSPGLTAGTIPADDDVYEQMAGLKLMEDERVENRRTEREAMNNLVFRLRKSVTALSKAS